MKVLKAQWISRCVLCDDLISLDDEIVLLDDDAVHAACAEDEGMPVEWP